MLYIEFQPHVSLGFIGHRYYGIYANGLLAETTSIDNLKNHSNMTLMY